MSARILITGRTGFVGGALATRLQGLGWEVVGTGRRPLDEPRYLSHDLAQPLPGVLDGHYDVVVHAGARSSPWGRRREFTSANVDGTRHVIDFCERNACPKLIYISSPSVYYRPQDQFAITEDTPLPAQSVNIYAETKRHGEELVRRYAGAWAILRPRAVFGPGDTVLIPRIVAAARQRRLPVIVPTGEPVVGDLIYIENLVDYILRAAEDPAIIGDYNLTNNQPAPMYDMVHRVLAELQIPPPTRRVFARQAMFAAALIEGAYRLFSPDREPSITRFGVHVLAYSKTFDVSKAVAAMGPPRVTLDDGLAATIAQLRQTGG